MDLIRMSKKYFYIIVGILLLWIAIYRIFSVPKYTVYSCPRSTDAFQCDSICKNKVESCGYKEYKFLVQKNKDSIINIEYCGKNISNTFDLKNCSVFDQINWVCNSGSNKIGMIDGIYHQVIISVVGTALGEFNPNNPVPFQDYSTYECAKKNALYDELFK